jgi:deoxyribodipyrimidine photo-lyase
LQGGTTAAEATLKRFLGRRLARYSERRNHPDYEVTSELSPYLHFGHIASHEVFHGLAAREKWAPHRSSESATGSRSGWWGMSESAEAFLDQLVTWRELGFNMSWQDDDCERYGSLPAWAQTTLAEHAGDPRPHVYSLEQFESATTHDPLWNAAQTQLLREGRLQNYLRMLWGKKILEWSADPRDALEIMIELNNKYALDGRDPNSTSGIFWILGRYDRAWGPERPIFGKVRYMSSANTARKLRLRGYMERYASES